MSLLEPLPLETPALSACDTAVVDALPRVSHRERRHAVDAGAAAPGRYLQLEDGDDRLLLPLELGATSVGRGFGVGLRLEDQSVSRRHAIVFQRLSGTRILDDRSANGTFVNGRRTTEAELQDGDVIVLGRVVLTYLDVPAR